MRPAHGSPRIAQALYRLSEAYYLREFHSTPATSAASLGPLGPLGNNDRSRISRIAEFLAGQLESAPLRIRAPLRAGLFVLSFFLGGAPDKRISLIARLKSSKIRPLRDFVSYFEVLSLLAAYSAPPWSEP